MPFEAWAILEIMGHQRIAGHVTEEQVAGALLLRVDVPEIEGVQAFTKYYSAASIYCLTPTDEETARLAVQHFRERPIDPYIVRMPTSALLAEKSQGDGNDDLNDEDDPYDGDELSDEERDSVADEGDFAHY